MVKIRVIVIVIENIHKSVVSPKLVIGKEYCYL